ncbi:hypothetical protein MCHI_003203 [Candidatus Magnetoovum chiemensis]|nr:hypothetical protein MCHI_003203 [Candidatus Magnetoovum chiemensis]
MIEERMVSKKDPQDGLTLTMEKIRSETKIEIEKTRVEIERTRADLEVKIETIKSDMIKWVAGMLIAQAAIVAALVKLL